MKEKGEQVTRREMVKKAVFVAPLVLTLPASAAFAQNGSSSHGHGGRKGGRGWGRRDD